MNFVIPDPADGPPAMDDECIGYVPDMIIGARRFAHIEWMTPREFLDQADPSFDPEADDVDFRQRSIDFMTEAIDAGQCFAPLELWPGRPRSYGLKHEGRHRAWVAEQIGIDEVPVYIWTR